MDPTVTAAAIGVGGTVLVGVAGFGAAIWNTRRTIAHARESRVWDRRAEVYVDALAGVRYWQLRREYEVIPNHPSYTKIRKNAEEYFANHKPPDWSDLETRLQAFASTPVLTAVQASFTAHDDVFSVIRLRQVLARAEAERDAAAAAADAEKKWKTAEAADDAVVKVIRAELQERGRSPGDWQPWAVTAPGPAPEAPGETGTTGTIS